MNLKSEVKIPKWLRISGAVIIASASAIFAFGGVVREKVISLNEIPSIKTVNEKQDIEIRNLKLAQQNNALSQENSDLKKQLEMQQTLEKICKDNASEHSILKSDIRLMGSNIKQLEEKTDQVLEMVVKNYYKDRVGIK